jgi:histidinol-phosphatase (PHP family)
MTVENILEYLEVAKARGLKQMGITEHDRYLEDIDLSALQEAREEYQEVELRLGIEIDFVPGAEERMERDANALPYDYVIGSVHRVQGEEVDHPDHREIYEKLEPYELYERYYANVREAALSGRFEILGHPDLIKIFRTYPDQDITPMLEETADAVAESGVVVDVNAAGLRKPIGEVYPSRQLLEMLHRRGVPIILSSDAHAPDQVALGYDKSLKLVHEVGYREVVTFKERERGTLTLAPQ